MKLIRSILRAGILLCTITPTLAATSWTFGDATVSVTGKGSGIGSGFKEKLNPNKPFSKPITFAAADSLKIILTTQEGKSAKRPHQAFLLLKDPTSNLDLSYPFSVKETGKAKVELTHKDLPVQFLRATKPLSASIVIGSFGSSAGYNAEAFPISVQLDPNQPVDLGSKPVRYGKLPEIHHIFRGEAKSPNVVISFVFTCATLATFPILLGAWIYLGGNISHLSKALSDAPISHALFLASIIGLETVLFLYYTSWNLFQALPALTVLGVTAFLSGSRALTEVQERRLAGLR